MGRVVELPPELWLMIFDLAIDANIDPVDHCTYLTFPEISDHLCQPSRFPSVIHSFLQNLRLVCRAFKRLLKSSPYFLMGDLDGVMPRYTRALCIAPDQNVEMYLERALSEPGKCRQIVLLNLLGAKPQSTPYPISFDCLCDNAQFLPELRGLSIRVRSPDSDHLVIPRFWNRLHESFPLLTSLVLPGPLYTTYSNPTITFEKLKILDWDHFTPHSALLFPALRYLALRGRVPFTGRLNNYYMPWSRLESLILRDSLLGFRFPLHLLPNLRMLGIPQENGYIPLAVTRLPEGHPMQHLHVYVASRYGDMHNQTASTYEDELAWLKDTITQLPTLTQIVLCLTSRNKFKIPIVQGISKMKISAC